jgi:hypothetical protein
MTRAEIAFHGRRRTDMRNLLALFGLLVVGFAGIGWHMGWYKLSFTRGTDGNLEIKTDVDTKKVETDSTDALKNLGTAIGSQAEKAAQDAKTSVPAGTPGSTPGPVTPEQTPAPNPLTPAGAVVPVAPTVLPTIPVAPGTPHAPGRSPHGSNAPMPPK